MATLVRVRQPGGLERLEIADGEVRTPGPGEVMVRIGARSLNYQDYLAITRHCAVEDGRTPLSDGAGQVIEVGEGIDDLRPGDRVSSVFFPDWSDGAPDPQKVWAVPGNRVDGFASEIVTAPARYFSRAPAGWTDAEAATLPCAGLTAWRALFVECGVRVGDVVLVQGSGGVSVFALQFAKAAGATVIATSSSDAKLERMATLGADHLINYRATPAWGLEASRFTGDRGVDVVVDIGGGSTLRQSLEASRPGGRIAVVGILDSQPIDLAASEILRRQVRLQGLTVGSREHHAQMVRQLEQAGIRPVIDNRRFLLAELAEAFRYQLDGQHLGKIVVES